MLDENNSEIERSQEDNVENNVLDEANLDPWQKNELTRCGRKDLFPCDSDKNDDTGYERVIFF